MKCDHDHPKSTVLVLIAKASGNHIEMNKEPGATRALYCPLENNLLTVIKE